MTTRILVTGGNGFLGGHLVERLRATAGNVVFAPPVTEFDLLVPDDVEMLLELSQPHVVIHLAAKVGGIGALTSFPGDIVWDTSQPNGQPRRKLDTPPEPSSASAGKRRPPLAEGLRKTLDWFSPPGDCSVVRDPL